MFIHTTPDLVRRDWYYSSNGGARYAFLAFLVAVVVVVLLTTCIINVRRIKAGRRPIVSRYLAPPSYIQSQREYNGGQQQQLPTYTEEANPMQDVGYYDEHGNFVAAKTGDDSYPPPNGPPPQASQGCQMPPPGNTVNPSTTYANQPPTTTATNNAAASGLQPARLSTQGSSNDASEEAANYTQSHTYATNNTNTTSTIANEVPPTYTPPAGPPPAHTHEK